MKPILSQIHVKDDFPILESKYNGKTLTYIDSAATSQKPEVVIKSIENYYRDYNSNVHRGIYSISEKATSEYEKAHDVVAKFINADPEEIVFTKGTTESLNLLAYSLLREISSGNVVVSKMEHHSNLVPWQQLCKEKGIEIRYINVSEEGVLVEDAKDKIDKDTKVVSVTHVGNVFGCVNDVRELCKIAHEDSSLFVLDGAQSVPHFPVDVKKLDCDFLAFSSHKMLGPMGVGVLYGKKEFLEKLNPFNYGGDMIKEVSLRETKFNSLPWRFEAGTPNVAGAIGLKNAVRYLEYQGMEHIQDHEKSLLRYAEEHLSDVKGIRLYGKNRNGLISFNIDKVHAHDVAGILAEDNIAVRAGHMCCMPLMKILKVPAVVRASFYLYNTEDDVDRLIESLENIKRLK